ncbi:helix-hairpin-helix domain-containing protein [Chryseobacterium arthrosphaerae]|uniref:helix-hairpin-helix domain-containing protein n=1 Tax=Chryseobacterium arthrosphaerae TaxID=651561 RepID=UPI001F4A2D12|nr:helix-hairpin-helix domain-containing protein [Chryseobacterium arthrosphaerae]MDG4651633.1 helix-hairpin-helix domain-containing protein [Chryseobacterium arthrosphaerae]
MMRKNYYHKLACMVLLLSGLLIYQSYTSRNKEPFPDVKFIVAAPVSENLSAFDPNTLNHEQWQKLGFSEKQVSTILKYKDIVGGKFVSKEQLKKCYAISEEKFEILAPFILLPENTGNNPARAVKSFEKRSILVTEKFNPDLYSEQDWIKMGFSEKQAEAILKYKKYLGGSFVSKEKFKECFIISSEHYSKLEPYLLLPVNTPAEFRNSIRNTSFKEKIRYTYFDPNLLDTEGWKALGFSEKQAVTIVNYRDRNLKGSFKSPEDLQKCFVISTEKFQELKPYIKINPAAERKQELKQEKTDFSKTDLNTITFRQLLEFGLDEKSAGSIIGFRKKLGGFVNKQQIMDTYNIDKELVQKLISIAPLDASNVPKYSLAEAPEEWLKNHPYFKYSADKIIYYRISNPDDRKIWKFLKLKPEYETRMRWYVK